MTAPRAARIAMPKFRYLCSAMKRVLIVLLLSAASLGVRAQVSDVIGGYNFSEDNNGVAAILSSYADDAFGSTYARADFAFRPSPFSLRRTYLEIARSLVFWKGTKFENLGLHAEFNGFMNMDNCNWLFGVDYTLPTKDLVKVSLLYKTFNGNTAATVPVQLSVLWDMRDLFNVSGLEFRGLFKAWGEDTRYWYGDADPKEAGIAYFIIKATPQIWYSAGQFFGWDGLSLGGEVELSYNYLGCSGFRARPMAGLRISF